jgi:hypothetical protein
MHFIVSYPMITILSSYLSYPIFRIPSFISHISYPIFPILSYFILSYPILYYRIISYLAVLRVRIRDPGSGAFWTPGSGIWDPE